MRTKRNSRKGKRIFFLIAVLVSFACEAVSQTETGQKKRVSLDSGWRFREVGKEQWFPATVPGCIHTDLIANKVIDDPFYRDNEKKLQWIGKTDWEYELSFQVAPQLLARQHLELVFEGLDTYADVALNDKPVLSANNMFRTWRVDCKPFLHEGDNVLRVRFRSPINEVLPLMAGLSYQLPAPNDQGEKTSPYTRKAPYQFGWDWGPRFVTSGIWKPVFIESWNEARVNDLHLIQRKLSTDVAELTAEVEVITDTGLEGTLVIKDGSGKSIAVQQSQHLKKGANRLLVDFTIPHPSLWWPNGMGRHELYKFTATLLSKQQVLDEVSVRTGLRTLELRRQPDQWGQSFAFFINGVPVFARGANWIPADSFPTRITREHYRHLIQSARDMNMNMLRVWGGGIYERDDFYELCDEMGILLWQEFMFACSMYPGDEAFLNNVKVEAIDNVRRLRNHPSIVIWSGNNEVETAWLNWGWRQTLPAKLWDDYQKLFEGVLKEVCETWDPSRPYWPSSPHGGMDSDPNSLKSGDTHSWKVWHAAAPFRDYEKEFPRFMSEYGFQSFPQIESVNTYVLPSEQDIESPIMLAHQRHPRGNQLIREYMLREYPKPKDFESFLYVSQVLQAEGIKIGAEHLRRIMPRNMGSLYWQIDDCWPVASWSSIDYYGRWKALAYYTRRFYGDLLISPSLENNELQFYVVSDLTKAAPAELKVSVIDLDGQVMSTLNRDVQILPLTSRSYFSTPVASLVSGGDSSHAFIHCELIIQHRVVSSNNYFLRPFKELAMPRPNITPQITGTGNGLKVSLRTDKFAKAVYLNVPGDDGSFSENYFDLIPGQPVVVGYHPRTPISPGAFREKLKIRSLVDAF